MAAGDEMKRRGQQVNPFWAHATNGRKERFLRVFVAPEENYRRRPVLYSATVMKQTS